MKANEFRKTGILRTLLKIMVPVPYFAAMILVARWAGETEGLKDPEFVPVYDENDEYIGITHPRLVESMDCIRKSSKVGSSPETEWDKSYEIWFNERISF